MALNFNFADVESSSFAHIKPGVYHAAIFEAEEKESQNSEHNYLSIQFKILEGVDADGNSAVNRRVWGNYSFSPKALFRLKSLLLAAGYTEAEINDPEFTFEPQDLVGKVVRVSLGVRTYEGEKQNTVKGEKQADPTFDPEAAEAAKINDGPEASAPTLTVSDDDLPFEV